MKESPVFVKMFEFVAWIIPLSAKFPREQRFIVARALQREALAAHEDLIRAGREVATRLALIRSICG